MAPGVVPADAEAMLTEPVDLSEGLSPAVMATFPLVPPEPAERMIEPPVALDDALPAVMVMLPELLAVDAPVENPMLPLAPDEAPEKSLTVPEAPEVAAPELRERAPEELAVPAAAPDRTVTSPVSEFEPLSIVTTPEALVDVPEAM